MRALSGGIIILLWLLPVRAADLKITVVGLRNTAGVLRLSLYDKEEAFLDADGRLASVRLQVWSQPIHVCFAGLPPGTYAVTVHHDEDGDGKLKRNLIGLPREGYGFSRDARGVVGPPSFAQTGVTVEDHDVQITITMRY